ncbi:hypothetical protein HMPREF0063_11352 [Aeromicrobium marinum DSM 15272]|uniref:Uncharacterized protein n=1 Tax=Aeromicrobium marinum DSM 15272 TaxID=585531 RepID=E2SBE3_9ACTN|nr:hypothetical protein [Aeromicrobium marinum]EFQ83689.1 hypothetical protein HMPREF0063_11352 [Aeromicrobium marinum DSM 15272]
MNLIRLHPRASAVLAGVLALVVVVAVSVLTYPSDDLPAPESTDAAPGEIELPSIEREQLSSDQSVQELTEQGVSSLGTGGGFGGLRGEGGNRNLQGLAITLTVTSSVPIGTVGYIIPTSLDRSFGVDENVGTSFALSTTVYGPPDHAQIFVQAGPTGAPVTCTITVDGQVTEQRSTEGPYGQMLCQG